MNADLLRWRGIRRWRGYRRRYRYWHSRGCWHSRRCWHRRGYWHRRGRQQIRGQKRSGLLVLHQPDHPIRRHNRRAEDRCIHRFAQPDALTFPARSQLQHLHQASWLPHPRAGERRQHAPSYPAQPRRPKLRTAPARRAAHEASARPARWAMRAASPSSCRVYRSPQSECLPRRVPRISTVKSLR